MTAWRLYKGKAHAFGHEGAKISRCGNVSAKRLKAGEDLQLTDLEGHPAQCSRCVNILHKERPLPLTTDEWSEQIVGFLAQNIDASISVLTDLEGEKAYGLRRMIMISVRQELDSWEKKP